MDLLRRLKNQWALGFAALFFLALAALAFAMLAVLVAAGVWLLLWLATLIFGLAPTAPSQPDADGTAFLAWTAIIWLPLSAGVILPSIARNFASQIREIDESRGKAEMAAIMRQKI